MAIEVRDVSDLDMAFGGEAMKLLPPMAEIPDDFKHMTNKWVRIVSNGSLSGCPKEPRSYPSQGLIKKRRYAWLVAACVHGSRSTSTKRQGAPTCSVSSLTTYRYREG